MSEEAEHTKKYVSIPSSSVTQKSPCLTNPKMPVGKLNILLPIIRRDIMLAGADRGYVSGDEWRDKLHLPPAGLKDYKVLENYIPADMSGKQKKLVQDGE